jgi:hypothetical protein
LECRLGKQEVYGVDGPLRTGPDRSVLDPRRQVKWWIVLGTNLFIQQRGLR